MTTRIQTDVGALAARRQILLASQRVLASARGLSGAGSGGGGSVQVDRLRAEARAFARAAHATLQGLGSSRAQGLALREVGASLSRLRDLAARRGVDPGAGLPELELAFGAELERMRGLAAGAELDLGPGPGSAGRAELPDLGQLLALGSPGIADPAGAGRALAQLDAVLGVVSRARSQLDAKEARLVERHAALSQAWQAAGGEPPADVERAEARAAALGPRLREAPAVLSADPDAWPADLVEDLLG